MNKLAQRSSVPSLTGSPRTPKEFDYPRIDVSKYELNKEIDRRRSFIENIWYNEHVQVEDLARLGLYFVKRPDFVECNFCEVVLSEFEPNDNVLKEHLKFSPNCPLLRRRETDNEPFDSAELDKILPPISIDECGSRRRKKSRIEDELAYPEYRLPSARLKSFDSWPIGIQQKPESLSDAGFFYIGQSDITICFSCGLIVGKWEANDSPWIEHKKLLKKSCNYLNMNQKALEIEEKKYEDTKKSQSQVTETKHEDEDSDKEVDYETVCKICLKNKSSILFLPCKHVAVCGQCVFGIDEKCPICRSKINEKIPFIYS